MRLVRVEAGGGNGGRTRVLGVDPGTVATGWGIVEEAASGPRHIASGVVRARGSRAERLALIHQALCDLCRQFTPSALSLEKTFVGDNVQSAFRLGEARGAVMVAAAGFGLAVAEYSPAEIKVAVAGSGRAAKSQVQSMVGRLLGLARALAEDEADALGAALCHVQTSRFAASVAARDRAVGKTVLAGAARRPVGRRR